MIGAKLFAHLKGWWKQFRNGLDVFSDQNDVFLGPGLWPPFSQEPPLVFSPCAHLHEREVLRVKVLEQEAELLALKQEARACLSLLLKALEAEETEADQAAQQLAEALPHLQTLLWLPEDATPAD